MEQYKFNNTQDIETLRQKLGIYKQTLEGLKAGNLIEDYFLTKHECYEIKKQVSNLEGEINKMKENQDMQINRYTKVENISEQIETVTDSIRLLKQDVALLMGKVNNSNFNDLLNKIDKLIDIQYTSISSIQEGNMEIKGLKEEITQLKKQGETEKQSITTNPAQKPQPSNYRQLQNILQSSKNIQAYSDEEKGNMPMRQDYSQRSKPLKQHFQQGIPTEGRKVKRTPLNRNGPQQHQDLQKMNTSINKTKKNVNRPSFSFNEQNHKSAPKSVFKAEVQNNSQLKRDLNTSSLNKSSTPFETEKQTNEEILKVESEKKSVYPEIQQKRNGKSGGNMGDTPSKPPLE
ncbi:hypothetical protein [Halalkalibacter alkalisediminis]|uniref:Uncharacterized protein n=1 Tax=Halalkalibacter alkalisediminis TaxID=935616 RepID=A0ABV6NMH9_9BACI|nr:hypothetical protein [Halalkalibacter alkalisediminis]